MTEGALTTQFAYNGDGVRMSKTAGETTTDYVLDLAATLPVVISDTDAIYLYGLDIIAEQLAGSQRYYYKHDGLGSVRQLVGTTGQIAANYAYDPFGVPLARGAVPNPWRFTGEAWDAEVELLYLRARYYQPETGRFVTVDPASGGLQRPGSLHPYVYVTNNPVDYVDPSGLEGPDPHGTRDGEWREEPDPSPLPVPPGYPDDFVDHRDLTIWLVEELSTNASSPEVLHMRLLNLPNPSPCPGCRIVAGIQWIRRVADNHVWDFKDQIWRDLREVIMLRHAGEDYGWYNYQMPGNIHYAYVGRAAGWSGEELHWGAGQAEMFDPGHKRKGQLNSCYVSTVPCNYCPGRLKVFRNPEWEEFGYDNPEDWSSVEFGIQLYEQHPVGLTLGQFRRFLSSHGGMLNLSVRPEPSNAGQYRHPRNLWPYWRGYFNGWRTDVSPVGWPYD